MKTCPAVAESLASAAEPPSGHLAQVTHLSRSRSVWSLEKPWNNLDTQSLHSFRIDYVMIVGKNMNNTPMWARSCSFRWSSAFVDHFSHFLRIRWWCFLASGGVAIKHTPEEILWQENHLKMFFFHFRICSLLWTRIAHIRFSSDVWRPWSPEMEASQASLQECNSPETSWGPRWPKPVNQKRNSSEPSRTGCIYSVYHTRAMDFQMQYFCEFTQCDNHFTVKSCIFMPENSKSQKVTCCSKSRKASVKFEKLKSSKSQKSKNKPVWKPQQPQWTWNTSKALQKRNPLSKVKV